MSVTDFHFLRPWWLLALPAAVALGWWFWRRLVTRSSWNAVCDPALLPHLLSAADPRRVRNPVALLLVALCVAVLALAGPTWQQTEMPVFRSLDARVIVLDLSRSMDVPDLKPSRLARARFKAADLLQRAEAGQTGLIAFAGDAFLVAPLTQDANTLLNLLPALDSGSMPVQGSRPDRGLELAKKLLEQAGATSGHVFLITDGADAGNEAAARASELRDAGFGVSVIAAGTAAGAPIPLASGGFLKNSRGQIVIPKLDIDVLERIATRGGGVFMPMTGDDADVERLSKEAQSLGRDTELAAEERQSERWQDEGPWLVLALLPIACLAFRRGWLIAVAAVAIALDSAPVYALDWQALWLRPDQRAARAFAAGNLDRALTLAADPRLRASALYRAKRFDEAERGFAQRDDADSHYNRGNALAKAGRFEEAMSAYDSALERDPEHDDAGFNRGVIQKMLEQQQSGSNDSGSGDSESGDDPSASEERSQENAQAGGSSTAEGQAGELEADAKGTGAPEDADSANRAYDEQQQSEDDDDRHSSNSPKDQAEGQSESSQAIEQWLRRIPDDPGGLLRSKFAWEFRRRAADRANTEDAW